MLHKLGLYSKQEKEEKLQSAHAHKQDLIPKLLKRNDQDDEQFPIQRVSLQCLDFDWIFNV